VRVVIHGHFYQPPREDPWIEQVETEPSAAPFHDWNERIEQECYRAVAAARIPGHEGRILRIVNTLERISFNFGPTLLEWMERQAPATYAAVLEADRTSAARLGHGNAVAMPYHHAILPLSTRREKVTEVRWGIADFRRRYGREPEGMWLPETAVDEETLEVLAGEGIRFTILAPHQVTSAPASGAPGLYCCPGGATIALFVYDGPMSHDVAFGPLVRDADQWVRRTLAAQAGPPQRELVSVATDGETYGHHHVFGEMSLALVLDRLQQSPGISLGNFAQHLTESPATEEVKLVSPSSWSCPHGVERWRSDCGCRMATELPHHQAWRAPLREGLAWLTSELHTIHDREAPLHLRDPVVAREGFGAVVGASPEVIRAYVLSHALKPQEPESVVRAAELLELERGALRSLTSCAWFFDDIGGIETLQVLRYAAWAAALAGEEQARLEMGLIERLAPARSRDPAMGTGADIYRQKARPRLPPDARIAGGLGAVQAIVPDPADDPAYTLEAHRDSQVLRRKRTGRGVPCRVTIEKDGLDLAVSVTIDGWGPLRLDLEQLPERTRFTVSDTMRRGALARLLSSSDLAAISTGEETKSVVRRVLLEATRSLEADRSTAACTRVADLAALLAHLGQAVPFDVQTVFYRIWSSGEQRDPAMLDLAVKLGFDVTHLRQR
jgi:hypothetical protein